MAIEFPCPHCDHLLRTADDKAGLSAKCPACGEAIWVPYPHERQATSAPSSARGESAVPPLVPPAGDDVLRPPLQAEAPRRPEGLAGDEIFETDTAAPRAPAGARPYRRRESLNCPTCGAPNERPARQCQFCNALLPEAAHTDDDRPWTPPAFDVGEVMSSAWKVYSSELGLLIGCLLLMYVLFLGLGVLIALPIVGAAVALQNEPEVAVTVGALIGIPAMLFVSAAILIGHTHLYLKAARGPGAGVMDLFYGFTDGRRFILRALLVGVVLVFLMLIGFLLFCIPGLVVMLVAWPLYFILLDRDPPGGDVLGIAFNEIRDKFVPVILIGLLAFAINMVGSVIPYLGIIVSLFTAPYIQLMCAIGYLRMSRQRTAVD